MRSTQLHLKPSSGLVPSKNNCGTLYPCKRRIFIHAREESVSLQEKNLVCGAGALVFIWKICIEVQLTAPAHLDD